jgi:hypothetical protein
MSNKGKAFKIIVKCVWEQLQQMSVKDICMWDLFLHNEILRLSLTLKVAENVRTKSALSGVTLFVASVC